MKEKFEKFRKPIIFAGVLIAVFTVYSLFIKKDPEPDLAIIKPGTSATVQDNKELLSQLQALNAITLDTSIFQSNIFRSLVDNTIIIENRRPEGRRNPFLPIGVDDGIFTADASIVGATNNTNGLLTKPTVGTTTKPEITKNAQIIKQATTTVPQPQVKTNSTSTKIIN